MRGATWLLTVGMSAPASAQDLTFSVTADKTTVRQGEPLQLTIALSGEIDGVELPPLEFPEPFAVVGRSHSTNFSLRAGVTERSMSLVYVLVPQQAGTFRLGPFSFEHRGKALDTDAIEITVEPPPPDRPPPGKRFTL